MAHGGIPMFISFEAFRPIGASVPLETVVSGRRMVAAEPCPACAQSQAMCACPVSPRTKAEMQFQNVATIGGGGMLPSIPGGGMLEGLPGGLLGSFVSRAIKTRRDMAPLTTVSARTVEIAPDISIGFPRVSQPTVVQITPAGPSLLVPTTIQQQQQQQSNPEKANILTKWRNIKNLEEILKGYQAQFDAEQNTDKRNDISKKIEDAARRVIDWRNKLAAELPKGVTVADIEREYDKKIERLRQIMERIADIEKKAPGMSESIFQRAMKEMNSLMEEGRRILSEITGTSR